MFPVYEQGVSCWTLYTGAKFPDRYGCGWSLFLFLLLTCDMDGKCLGGHFNEWRELLVGGTWLGSEVINLRLDRLSQSRPPHSEDFGDVAAGMLEA